jgi:2,7-dihydroxy-5-methyl-1-naphthoate 7-O-methyltransferase
MTARGIGIIIDCDEVAACHQFYIGVLGLTPLNGSESTQPPASEPGQLRLRATSHTLSGGEQAHPAVSFAVEVPDVDDAYRAAQAAGHPIVESLHNDVGVRRFTVIDPQGTSVAVYTRMPGSPGAPATGTASQDRSAWAVLAAGTDLRWPYAVRVAATLRLADLIASGITDAGDLGARAGADAGALGRLLRYLAWRGVFREARPGRFEMTDIAELLREDHPSRLRAWLDLEGAGGRMDQAFSGLLDVVRTGQPAYPGRFGRDLWADLNSSPELAASFDSLMAGHSERFAAEVVSCCDWTDARVAVDVGGGTGGLLAQVLRANPRITGVLVDQESPAAVARQRFADEDLVGRGRVVVGSFFRPLPASGDVYLLSRILHDWNDDDAVRILRNCAAAGGPRARVIVIEAAGGEGESLEQLTARDLRMLAVYGGQERTVAEIGAVATRAGLTVRHVTRTPSGLSVIDLRTDLTE